MTPFTAYLLDQFRSPRLTEAEARTLTLLYAQRRQYGVLVPERYQVAVRELKGIVGASTRPTL